MLLPVAFTSPLAPPGDEVLLPLPPQTRLTALHAQEESWDDPGREPASRSVTFANDGATTTRLVEHYRSLGWDLQRDELGWCAVSGPYSLAIVSGGLDRYGYGVAEPGLVTATWTRFQRNPIDCSEP